MNLERAFVVTSLAYAIAGMVLGVVMASTHDHSQHVTHAHILLVGFVVSFVYAVIHRLWLKSAGIVAKAQFALHQAGALGMVAGLFALYGGLAPLETLEPLLGASSIAVLLGMVVMAALVVAPARTRATDTPIQAP